MAHPDKETESKKTPMSEVIASTLKLYMAGEKVGSPKFMALYDLVETREIAERLDTSANRLSLADGKLANIQAERELNVAVYESALLSREMSNRHAKVPGYASANYFLQETISDLFGVLTSEIRSKYPFLHESDIDAKATDLLFENTWNILNSIIKPSPDSSTQK